MRYTRRSSWPWHYHRHRPCTTSIPAASSPAELNARRARGYTSLPEARDAGRRGRMDRDGTPERWRLFIAVALSEEARGALAEAQVVCRRCRLPLRWIEPRGAHLTVKFLGDVARERVPALAEALAGVAGLHEPFQLWT